MSEKREPTAFIGAARGKGAWDRHTVLFETARSDSYVVIANGPGKGREYALAGELTLIGRDPELGVSIDDPSVSRRHAAIVRKREGFWLRDLGSTNGTHFGGVLHGNERQLHDGDHFQLGDCELIFREGVPEPAGAPPLGSEAEALDRAQDTADPQRSGFWARIRKLFSR